MGPSSIEIVGTVIFAIAVLHTFLVKKIENFAHHYPEDSMARRTLHFFSEVEAVFGIWSLVFIIIYSVLEGFMVFDDHHQLIGGAMKYLENQNYTEPAFVFVIMCMAGTKPMIQFAEKLVKIFAKIIPCSQKMAFYCATLIAGPLLGSFITEPAAMTLTALILYNYFYTKPMFRKFRYATIGLLFVNVSIGGTLSHFAAPPVLMVAGKWHWGMMYMLGHFGYKAVVSIIISTFLMAFIFKNELAGGLGEVKEDNGAKIPCWVTVMQIVFMALVVYTAHHMVFFLALFLFFMGFSTITNKYQDPLKIRESLFVGFFLAGLVTLGSMQQWWLQDILTKMGDFTLYVGATLLTAVTDNAALTYLGSLVPGLADSAKHALVSGAVVGGGLTVIANAPNPAGYGILKSSFGEEGIGPLPLLLGALGPTLVAFIAFKFLPHLG